MVGHEINVQGLQLSGIPQDKPVLLQMNDDDFPARFLRDLGAIGQPPISSLTSVATSTSTAATLYQPVQRILHVALLQLTCNSVGSPRVDPTRVESAGLVVRRIPQINLPGYANPTDDLGGTPSAWMQSADGQAKWVKRSRLQECDDPDPARRPQIASGQPALDQLLALDAASTSWTESSTPAFVAPPAVCNAAKKTTVYAVLPTASSELSSKPPLTPRYDAATLASGLPTLLQAGNHTALMADQPVSYLFMSDDYARANGATAFLTFSITLRMLYSVFGAFESKPEAQALIQVLNKHFVYSLQGSTLVSAPMGDFYRTAASALIDYDPNQGGAVPSITMPYAWDSFTDNDAAELLAAITATLQARSSTVLAPTGRFQDSTRLYRIRLFFRIKGHSPACPTELVWSRFSDPCRIAAWYENGDRTQAPVPLPDPTDRAFLNSLKGKKPNSSFVVPASLMNAIQGSTPTKASAGGGIQLSWICGFNIPLITICAFFVLNIFLMLLNIVFFWLPFIKICIPFPVPTPASSGEDNGT